MPGKRQKRTNIIAGLMGDKFLAAQCYEHSTTAAFFEDWFEFELIPLLPEYSVIVMDNASFHRKKALQKIAERYDLYVLFLPPYSPDLNPIEKAWANFKQWLIYKHINTCLVQYPQQLADNTGATFIESLAVNSYHTLRYNMNWS
jgi:transposase